MYLNKAEGDLHVAKATIERFVFLDATGLTFWSRMRLAVSVILTPISVLLIGRSIAVRPKNKG